MKSFYLLLLALLPLASAYRPVVLWHGMGDSCCNPMSMGSISKTITDNHNGTYVYSIMTGSNVFEDTLEGFFADVNSQIETVCEQLKKDPKLSGGFHAMGFSQGGQFLRALVQRCNGINVTNLVTFGGQHEGVFALPHCTSFNGTIGELCEDVSKLLNEGAYEEYIQEMVVQAQYWHDPINEDEYRTKNIFLPDINQENSINETYRSNIKQLSNLVLVKFLQDSMVVPRDSAWFGYYTPGQDKTIRDLKDSPLYTEDRLGLKSLDQQGKLHFMSIDGDHLQIPETWLIENIIDKFLD